jgi:hypothetical protein
MFSTTCNNFLIRLFTDDEIKRIKEITLRDIIMAVTQMKDEDIQQNPFQAPSPSGASRFKHCHIIIYSDLFLEIPEQCRGNKDLIQDGSCSGTENTTCSHFAPLTANLVEPCVEAGTYDYFSNSETSYILTFAGLGTVIAG